MLPGAGKHDPDTTGIWRMASVGLTLVCEIIAGLVMGWGVDWLMDTDRVFFLIGGLMGAGSRFTRFRSGSRGSVF